METLLHGWTQLKNNKMHLMSHSSVSPHLLYTVYIPPSSLESTVKAKIDDSLWGNAFHGSIKLSIQLLTGLVCPLHGTEPERAILPRTAQGWPKGGHILAIKACQTRRVTFSWFGLHIAKQETRSEAEPEVLFQCERSCAASVVHTYKRSRKN